MAAQEREAGEKSRAPQINWVQRRYAAASTANRVAKQSPGDENLKFEMEL